MRIEELIYKKVTNNQEIFYIVDTIELITNIENGLIDLGLFFKSDNLKEKFLREVIFSNQHKGFYSSFYNVSRRNTIFKETMLLFFTDGCYERVHVEHVICENCGWNGDIANPTIADLYFSLSNSKQAVLRAFKLKRKPCPKCGAKLPRHAIWVNNEETV